MESAWGVGFLADPRAPLSRLTWVLRPNGLERAESLMLHTDGWMYGQKGGLALPWFESPDGDTSDLANS